MRGEPLPPRDDVYAIPEGFFDAVNCSNPISGYPGDLGGRDGE